MAKGSNRTKVGARAVNGRGAARGGLFARLRADVRANTLAIMAAALMPMCALAGSAVDMARMHVVKVRLQQACDAGVLAGRKFLPSGTAAKVNIVTASVPSTDATVAADGRTLAADGTQALTYFNNNIETSWSGGGLGWFAASTDKFNANTVADAQGNTQVAGQAQADVPMTLMTMFGFGTQTLKVTCQATFSTPDTDVMFVLDTTGSMGCAVTRSESSCSSDWAGQSANQGTYTKPDGTVGYYVKEEMSGSTNISRIDALRQAVNAFYSTVSTTKDASTNVRYGFAPYTSSVNVGSLLYAINPSYLVSKWSYQSRTPTGDYFIKTLSTKVVAAADQTACNSNYSRSPAVRVNATTGDASAGYPGGTATAVDPVWTTSPNKCTLNTDQVGPTWSYQPGVQYDLSTYLKGGSMADPAEVDGSTTTWNGCIEERDTTAGVTSFSQSSLPGDLDPDLIPTSDATRWRPMWSDVVYERYVVGYNNSNYNLNSPWTSYSLDDNSPYTFYNYNDPYMQKNGSASCPAQAVALFLPSSNSSGATTVSNFTSSLHALGGTYLDVGMIWGTRMLSPYGVFKTNNAWPAGRAEPKRVLVFVTDGSMSPSSEVYGAYATEYPDRKVTGTYFGTGDPSSGSATDTSSNNYTYTNSFHTQRLLAECARAKASPLNIDVWVVEVAQANTLPSATALASCASRPTQVLTGKSTAELKSAFQQIAQQVAMLRVSQ